MPESPIAPYSLSPAEIEELRDAESRGTPILVYRDGGGNQRMFELGEAHGAATVNIGRRPENEIPLSWDLEVSRVHAQLKPVGDDWALVDDGLSRNGSFVNGSRITRRRRLSDGDTLRIGKTVLVYCDPEHGNTRTTAGQDDHPSADSVSDAQRRVLIALCRPYKDSAGVAAPASNQLIADELVISVDAVKAHLRALFYIFGVNQLPQNQKRAQLVERAFSRGFVTERDL
jgi:pSer/pThr/pTyr-binding forkhead associated (FHA) protein